MNNSARFFSGAPLPQTEAGRIAVAYPSATQFRCERFSGIDVSVGYRSATPHQRLGGDFYGMVPFGDGGVTLYVGDVCGKGVELASYATESSHLMRFFLQHNPDPARAIQEFNTLLCCRLALRDKIGRDAPAPFVSLTCAMIYPEYSRCWVVRAGGEPALMLCRDGSHHEILDGLSDESSVSALPVGIRSDTVYTSSTIPFHSGDALLLFTNGLTQARDGRQYFGLEGILNAASSPDHYGWKRNPNTLVKHVFDSADAFHDRTRTDDTCLIAASFR